MGEVGGDLAGLGFPEARDLGEDLAEARPAEARRIGEIGAAPERRAIGVEEHGERPAALLAEGMERVHIEPVDIGPLLAVDLDADEVGVQKLGGFRVLEALMGHDVAPVAGSIADGEQDRLVLGAGAVERCLAPGQPMDRIEAMLEKIGARFAVKLVAAGSVVHHRFDSQLS